MEQIHERVAGLDVHRDAVAVCVRTAGRRGGVRAEKQRFKTTTADLARMAEWLATREVALVAMEATGVYWKPIHYALEDRFELWLCNAHHVKNVPGRKTDMSDAEWLADVAAHGMVRPSFVPPLPIRELRELTRYRKTQVAARASEIARLEKVLQDAGIKLTSVASKVLTQSGRAMIEALIAGERDAQALAQLAKGEAASQDRRAGRGARWPLRRPSCDRCGAHSRPPRLSRCDDRGSERRDRAAGSRRLPTRG
jgi:transposase